VQAGYLRNPIEFQFAGSIQLFPLPLLLPQLVAAFLKI